MSSSGNYPRKRNEPSRSGERIKKQKWKSGTQFPHIPEEILVTILSKLPIKSLLRFKCVSKPWRSLISNKKFNLSSPKQLVIVMSKYYASPDCSLHLINDEALSVEVPKPKQLKVRGRNLNCGLTIRGSCNGLVLLSNSVDLFLWNPSTRCCKRVLSHMHLTTFDRCHNASGLCYDSSTDDYKVVMACWGRSRECDDDKVMVGSFRNKTWTEVCFPYAKRRVKSGPTVHERLHWLVTNSTNSSIDETNFLVVGYDLRTNKFLKVPIPQGKKEKPVLCLGALDGSLTLWTDCRSGSEVEVFVMKKYGDQASWTSLFVISTVEHLFGWCIWVPLCFTKNGEVILQSKTPHLGGILVYNPEFNSFQHIQIAANDIKMWCQTHHYFSLPNAATFIESLVSPPNNNWEEEEEYTETFLSGVTKKWKREPGDVSFKVIDF